MGRPAVPVRLAASAALALATILPVGVVVGPPASAATAAGRASTAAPGEEHARVSRQVRRAVAELPPGSGPAVRVLVSHDEATRTASVLDALPADSFGVVQRYDELPLVALEIDAESLHALAGLPVRVVRDRPVRAFDAEAVPLVRADDVQDSGLTGEGVTVAVLDTGVDTSHGLVHPGLVDDVVGQRCYVPRDCPGGSGTAPDGTGHGTHVAGIVTGPDGIAPDATVRAYKVLDDEGWGADSGVLRALDHVVALNEASPGSVDLVNMSLGGGSYATEDACDAENPAYAAAVTALREHGVAVFAATGNWGQTDGVAAPACVSGVIGVGSTGDSDLPAQPHCPASQADDVSCFSNTTPVQGPGEVVDLVAPGCAITSLHRGGRSGHTMCGTSMASPLAAGVAALALQHAAEAGGTPTPAELEELLEATGTPVTDDRLGAGSPTYPRVDALAATGGRAGLGAPAGLDVSTADAGEQAALRWDPVPGATEYAVFRTREGGRAREPLGRGSATSWSDATVPCGPVTYSVRAGDGERLGEPAHVAVTARPCPARPSGLVLTGEGGTSALRWSTPDPQSTAVVLERRRYGEPYAEVLELPAGSTSAQDTVTGCGVVVYRLLVVRGADRSASSRPVHRSVCAPRNDAATGARRLRVGKAGTTTVVVQDDVRYAEVSTDDPRFPCLSRGTGTHGVWYRVRPRRDTRVVLDTVGTTATPPGVGLADTLLAVYSGPARHRRVLACNDDVPGRPRTARLSMRLLRGETYYVHAALRDAVAETSTGALRLALRWRKAGPRLRGDDLATARPIPGSGSGSGQTWVAGVHRATYAASDPVHRCRTKGASAGSHTVWWTFDASRDGRLELAAAGNATSDFTNTVMSVFRVVRGRLRPVACNDGSRWQEGTTIRAGVARGQRYAVLVSRWDEVHSERRARLWFGWRYTPGRR